MGIEVLMTDAVALTNDKTRMLAVAMILIAFILFTFPLLYRDRAIASFHESGLQRIFRIDVKGAFAVGRNSLFQERPDNRARQYIPEFAQFAVNATARGRIPIWLVTQTAVYQGTAYANANEKPWYSAKWHDGQKPTLFGRQRFGAIVAGKQLNSPSGILPISLELPCLASFVVIHMSG